MAAGFTHGWLHLGWRQPWRWLRGLLLLVLLLAALLALSVWWLASQPHGLQRALQFADGLGGVRLEARDVEGSVAGPFRIGQLVVHHPQGQVRLENLQGELRLASLWYGTLTVHRLRIAALEVRTLPVTQPPTPPGFLPAWLRVAVDTAQVQQTRIIDAGKTLTLGPLALRGSLSRWRLLLQHFSATGQGWQAQGTARLEATAPLLFSTTLTAALSGDLAGAPVSLGGTLGGTLGDAASGAFPRLHFQLASLRPAGISASGTLDLPPAGLRMRSQLQLRQTDLGPWGLAAAGALTADWEVRAQQQAPALQFSVRGPLSSSVLNTVGLGRWVANVQATLTPQALAFGPSALESATFGRLTFSGPVGRVDGLNVALQGGWPALRWPATLARPGLTLEQGQWTLRGRELLTVSATSGARVLPRVSSPHTAAVSVHPRRGHFSLKALLATHPSTTGRHRADRPDWQLTLEQFALQTGTSTVQAEGRWGQRRQLQFTFKINELNEWLPGYTGQLTGAAQLDDAQLAQAQLQARAVHGLTWPAGVALVEGSASTQFQLRQASLPTDFAVTLNTATWHAPNGSSRLDHAGAFKLLQPVALRVSPTTVQWAEACWRQASVTAHLQLCSTGHWAAATAWSATAHLTGLDLPDWWPMPPADTPGLRLGWQGRVEAELQVQQANPTAPLTGEAKAQLLDGGLGWARGDDQGRVALGNGRLEARLEADHWSLVGQVTAARRIEARGELTGPRPDQASGQARGRSVGRGAAHSVPWTDWPVSGQVTFALPALDFVTALVPEVDRVAGTLAATLQVSGVLGTPEIRGRLALEHGEVDVLATNLLLREVGATLDLAPGSLQLKAQAQAGTGTLQAAGSLQFGGAGTTAALTGSVHVLGHQLLLVDIPEARILASPDLTFTLGDQTLQVNGTVTIPSARLAPLDLAGAALSSADERLVGASAPLAASWRVDSRVKLVLGDEVRLETRGLSGRLTGSITAHAPPSGATTGTGELAVVDGRFRAYTRELNIERGRLLFAGSLLTDPGLDLRASKKFPGMTTAGVLVRGSLRKPLTRFFSDPPLSQSEIASLLVVGGSIEGFQTKSNVTGSPSSQTALAQQGGALLASQLGQFVGIDEVQLESGSNAAASLVLGKYLSPRLYVSYGVGLSEALNTLKLRYTLNDRWVLKTESGARQSLDLEFTLDR